MKIRYEAPGLSADWLNGWLAAIGSTVLVSGLRLAWSEAPIPTAIFEYEGADEIPKAISDAMPLVQALDQSPIAEKHSGCAHTFDRHVTLEAFRERAKIERALKTNQLASSVSDLRSKMGNNGLDHGSFDVPGPGTIGTLWDRVYACAGEIPVEDLEGAVRQSLEGHGRLITRTGLGFDPRRFPSGVRSKSDMMVDPIIELLAFAALELFPTRGNGQTILQRRWTDSLTLRGAFKWEAWKPSLDRWAIDAFLDLKSLDQSLVVARFQVVPYKKRAKDEMNYAYFAERIG